MLLSAYRTFLRKKSVMSEDDLLGGFSDDTTGGVIPLAGGNVRCFSTGSVRRLSTGSVEGARLLNGDHKDEDDFGDDPEFDAAMRDILEAINSGIHPTRIYQGSSGSYFARNTDNKIVGVFKPKDEEPYGHLNPKWTKWLHKTCCPCIFGRSCLVPNQGYLSEAGASIVDRRLNLGVVPTTKLVKLSSPAFNYSRGVRWFRKGNLPRKVGSLQLFVNGYKDAETVVSMFESPDCDPELKRQFAERFERLVVLDYVTRNTDRGNDNWLLRIEDPPTPGSDENIADQSYEPKPVQRVRIAAIDNGLSFPYKHPDTWRTYPYYWAWLPQAKVPFSDEIKEALLPLLTDETFVESIIQELYDLFKKDPGFSKSHFDRQAAVIRGQCLNLVTALKEKKTPLELIQMPVCAIRRKGQTKFQRFRAAHPFFKWC